MRQSKKVYTMNYALCPVLHHHISSAFHQNDARYISVRYSTQIHHRGRFIWVLQVGTKGLAGDSAMGSNAGGAQRAAQKFKLSSGKVSYCLGDAPPEHRQIA